MTTITLTRVAFLPDATFGYLNLGDAGSLVTVEQPWRNNEVMVSCIPNGTYTLRSRYYYRGGYDAWEIVNVPNRTHILIHKGNTSDDVRGCVAVGMKFGCVGGRWAVINSALAFDLLCEGSYGEIVVDSVLGGWPTDG